MNSARMALEQLRSQFGDRFSSERVERLLYGHDQASLPDLVALLLHTQPMAIIQPLSEEELVFTCHWAQQHRISLVPRGMATSAWGGALPVRGGIVVDFRHMNRILEIEDDTVTVEPGITWQALEESLFAHKQRLRLYPSSAPGSTVGGWVAEGGGGIGSYQYGTIGPNVASVRLITSSGIVKDLTGEELSFVLDAEGITGFISQVKLYTRKFEDDRVITAGFPTLEKLLEAVQNITEKNLPLWHISFCGKLFQQRRVEAETQSRKLHLNWDRRLAIAETPTADSNCCRALFVYPLAEATRIDSEISQIIDDAKGQLGSEAESRYEWQERFYPLRQKRLGPSLITGAALVELAFTELKATIVDIQHHFKNLALSVNMLGPNRVSIMGYILSDERQASYLFDFPQAQKIISIACSHGGVPYTTGLYFTSQANQILGDRRIEQLTQFKNTFDPDGIFNPGKVLPSNARPRMIHFAMGTARLFEPVLAAGRKILKIPQRRLKRLPKEISFDSFACAQCGYCVQVCTNHRGVGWESFSTRGRWYFLREYLKGKMDFNATISQSFLFCSTCQRCNRVCQIRSPAQEMWDGMRGELVGRLDQATFPGYEMISSIVRHHHNIWGRDIADRAGWMPDTTKINLQSKQAYWAGCTSSYIEQGNARNAVRILNEAGVDFTYLGTDEHCCGLPVFLSGKWADFELELRHNISQCNRLGLKEIFVTCPGCYIALAQIYPGWAKQLGLKYNVKVRHISEVMATVINDGRLNLKYQPPGVKRVTYHDPCHIGRHAGIYESPRQVLAALPGIKLTEMRHNREDALCCGSLHCRILKHETADIMAGYRIDEAEATGADALITTCPCCEVQLRVGSAANETNIPILDFSDLVMQSLGYDAPDPTKSVVESWDIFKDSLALLTPSGVNNIMGGIVPEMIAALPQPLPKVCHLISHLPSGPKSLALGALKNTMPQIIPRVLPGMLDRLSPKVTEVMKSKLCEMPPALEIMFPDIVREIIPRVVTPMLPDIMSELTQGCIQHLEKSSH
ncbi:MAG: FAD-binding and (Fe-S)-binding domain-containing protein [Dehalogenimonas sp.]